MKFTIPPHLWMKAKKIIWEQHGENLGLEKMDI